MMFTAAFEPFVTNACNGYPSALDKHGAVSGVKFDDIRANGRCQMVRDRPVRYTGTNIKIWATTNAVL